jgi:putative DNA primase/helicase
VLENDANYAGRLRLDLFARKPMYAGEEATDTADTEISTDIEYRYKLAADSKMVAEVAYYVASENAFHPVRDYLDGLVHDGTERMAGVFESAFGHVAPEGYEAFYRQMTRRFMIACVARIFEPGCKVDYMAVLTGEQYAGKSYGLRRLVSPPSGPRHGWFADSPVSIGEKDGPQQLRGNWLYELSELDSFRKAENTQTKAWLSSQEDNFRPPYGRHAIKLLRETMIVGSTNKKKFLTDPTGSRRYLVYQVGDVIDIAWIDANRDQLWAEAVAAYRSGEQYWFTREEVHTLNRLNGAYHDPHVWEDIIKAGIAKQRWRTCTITDVLLKVLGKTAGDLKKADKDAVADTLRNIGCRVDSSGAYVVPEELLTSVTPLPTLGPTVHPFQRTA